MTLGSRLRSHVPEGTEQKVIAMRWVERLEAAGLKKVATATATSRLSELFADDPQGVRAFFKEPQRASLLFDVLGVPEAERNDLRSLAEPVLAGAPHPRIVVDLSDVEAGRDAAVEAFTGLRNVLFGDDGIFPVAIVLTEAQFDLLPRSFDRLKERMQVVQVADPEEGAAAAIRLAGDGVTLLAQRPLVDLPRWWALTVADEVEVEPADGLDRVRATGRIGVPSVMHPIPDGPGAKGVKVPTGGVARRRLVDALADEESAESARPIEVRREEARLLGTIATSTARERIEAEVEAVVAALPMPVPTGKQADWDALVARAARRPVEPTAMRVGDIVLALNPPGSLESGARLLVARVACAEPQLVTLEREVAKMTEDDHLDDDLLGGVVHRLAGRDPQALKLLFHARAVLVYGGRVKPKAAEAVADPLAVLAKLLAQPVPKALIRVRVEGPSRPYGSKERNVPMRPFVYPDGKIYYAGADGSGLLRGVPPTGDVLWQRGSTLAGVSPATGRESAYAEQFHGHTRGYQAAGSPSALVDPRADAATWLDDVEASPFLGGTTPALSWSWGRHLPEPKENHTWTEIPQPARLWQDADIQLALAWLAVRDSLAKPRWIALPDGSVILQVGGGLAARIHVRRHGQPNATLRGAVRCIVRSALDYTTWVWSLGDLASPVTTHVANTDDYETRMSVLLPSLWIAGLGHAADIEFLPAPMLPGAGAGNTPGLASSGAIAATATARRKKAIDDSYDD